MIMSILNLLDIRRLMNRRLFLVHTKFMEKLGLRSEKFRVFLEALGKILIENEMEEFQEW